MNVDVSSFLRTLSTASKSVSTIVEVRRTFDLMDFYGKTVPRIVYVTTHTAVTVARTELSMRNFSPSVDAFSIDNSI